MEKLALKVLSICLRIDGCHVLSKIVDLSDSVRCACLFVCFLLVKTVLNCPDCFCRSVEEQKCSHDFSISALLFRKLVLALFSSRLVDLFPGDERCCFFITKHCEQLQQAVVT